MIQHGHARDLLTGEDIANPTVVARDQFTAHLSANREIESITSNPPRPAIEGLVGARAGGQLRAAIAEVLPADLAEGSPLYLLLDDIAGSSLVAPWGLFRWNGEWIAAPGSAAEISRRRQSMTGVCIGFSPGSPALTNDVLPDRNRLVEPLDATGDHLAWHELDSDDGPVARRARRIDVHVGERILIDAHFQDSAPQRDGGRIAVHEYLLKAEADRETLTLLSVEADPRILPFDHCPAAILNIGTLIGTPLAALRRMVLEELSRTKGCTHLNDMLRSLAEVPQLASILMRAMENRGVLPNSAAKGELGA